MPRPSSRARSHRRRRILAAVIAAGAALAALETTGRTLPTPKRPAGFVADAELGWALPANSQYTWHGTQVTTNGLGLRSAPPRRAALDLLAIGDSSVFGDGVEQPETFSARLEDRLAATLDAQVQNAGVPGYTCPQSAALLQRVLPEYAPDVLVIYSLNSDLRAAREGDVPATELGPLSDLGVVRLGTAAAHVLRRVTSSPGSALPAYRDCLEALVDQQSARGGHSVLVVPIDRHDLVWPPGTPSGSLGDYRDAMGEVARATGSPLVDLPTRFQASGLDVDQALLDTVHPTPTGHALIAEALAEALADAGLLTAP